MSPPVTFTGNATLATDLLKKSGTGLGQRVLDGLLGMKESNISYLTFLQDTAVAWLPKFLTSRSHIEGAEVTLLEMVESALVYFALPLLGGPLLGKLMHKVAGAGLDGHLLTQTVAELEKGGAAKLAKALPAKAAVIVSTIAGIGLLGESLSNYGKNLMTAYYFKKDKFSDVVNLSQGAIATPSQESPLVKKSLRRLGEVTAAFGGILLASMAFARFGPRWLKQQPALDATKKLVRLFDFKFGEKKALSGPRTGMLGAMMEKSCGLGTGMLGAIMGLSFLPYLDAARDKYEFRETLIRLPIVFGYLLFGQKALEKGMQLVGGKWFAPLLKDGELRTQQALKAAGLQTLFARKAVYVGVPLLTGVTGVGFLLSWLNQRATQARYEKQQQTLAAAAAPPTLARPVFPATPAFNPPPGTPQAFIPRTFPGAPPLQPGYPGFSAASAYHRPSQPPPYPVRTPSL